MLGTCPRRHCGLHQQNSSKVEVNILALFTILFVRNSFKFKEYFFTLLKTMSSPFCASVLLIT
jgi:hypothetical protein